MLGSIRSHRFRPALVSSSSIQGLRKAYLYSQDWKELDRDVDQATRQLQAADARGVGLKWYFAEAEAAEKARRAFDDNGLDRVVISVMPARPRR